MEIKLTIRPKSQDVPTDFICVFLNKTLDMPLEECEKLFKERGSITVFVRNKEVLEKIQTFGKKYEHLIDIKVEKGISDSSIFNFIKDFTLNNLVFVIVWCSILLILIGFSYEFHKESLGSFLITVFFISSALKFMEVAEREEKDEELNLTLFSPLSDYISTAFGLTIGQYALGILAIIVFYILFAIVLSLVTLPVLQILAAFFLGIFAIGAIFWYFYVFPIILANAYGENSFAKGFKAIFSIFKKENFKFSFTKRYFKWGMLWAFVFTIIPPLLFTVAITGIGIPVALIGAFWLALFLGVVAYCVKKEMNFAGML